MARAGHNLDFQHPSHLHGDQKPPHVDPDDFAVLDDAILDRHSPAVSPGMRHRRESFVDSTAAFSPSEPAWSTYQFGSDQVAFHPTGAAAHSFVQADVFPSAGPSPTAPFPPHQAIWPVVESSGSCTPTAVPDALGPEYEGRRPTPYGQEMGRAPHQASFDALQLPNGHPFLPTAAFSTPPSGKDWMSVSSAEGIDFRSISAQPRPHSPSFLGSTSLLRRDGIRKKNARFEIPAERNLRTIDQLITQTNDEQEIKELKQQKRLLRNRQAALDSRQRKKQHTERLEDEKKHYTAVINDLEEALGEMKVQEAELTREKESWAATQLQYQQYIESMLAEKEELVRRHTIDAGELRKKNAILMDQLQRADSTAMSAAPSSAGFSADFSDFDHLTMHSSSPWDDFALTHDFSIETDPPPNVPAAAPLKHEKNVVREDDRATASGFLLTLLLFGAWVGSRSSAGSTNLLPTMPEDMRTASATVLRDIYQDAGVQLQDGLPAIPHFAEPAHDTPTSAQDRHPTTLSAFEMANLSASPLDALHHHLAVPGHDPLHEQVFSVPASRYNELASGGMFDRGKPFGSGRRSNIGEALAAVRKAGDGPAADVYTRSLMWDKVPQQVLKDFARMVAESNAEQPQWKEEPMT